MPVCAIVCDRLREQAATEAAALEFVACGQPLRGYEIRIVDGREAVSFLRGIKDRIENPHTLLLEL